MESKIKIIVRRAKKQYAALGVLLSAILISGYVVAVLMLTQTFPVVAAANITSTCSSVGTPLTANQSAVVGGSGYIRFTCTVDTRAYRATQALKGTPTFSLPSGYTQLWSFQSSTGAGTTCAGGAAAWQMTSGAQHTFPSGNSDWDYCAVFSNPSADLATFTVAWNA